MRTPQEFIDWIAVSQVENEEVAAPEAGWPEFKDGVFRERVKLMMPIDWFMIFGFEFQADGHWYFRAIRKPAMIAGALRQ